MYCSQQKLINHLLLLLLFQAEVMCAGYLGYCGGLRNAVRLLMELREYDEFEQFIRVSVLTEQLTFNIKLF